MSKFTPGPWAFDRSSGGVVAADGSCVAGHPDRYPDERWAADAELAADAPVMLDLLHRCLGLIGARDEPGREMLRTILALIEKHEVYS